MKYTTNTMKAEQAKWNGILEAEGLGVIGPENLDLEIMREDEPVLGKPVNGPEQCQIPTENDYRILQRVRDAGYAATPDEANATMGAIRRLAGAGFANIRHHDGQKFLAIAGATDGDIERAAKRYSAEQADYTTTRNLLNRKAISGKILARLKKLGGACETTGLIRNLLGEYSDNQVLDALSSEALRGGIRRAKSPAGHDITKLAASPVTFADTVQRTQELSRKSQANRALRGKNFPNGMSTWSPKEANPNEEERGKDEAGELFRSLYRLAKERQAKAESTTQAELNPETPSGSFSGVPAYLATRIAARKRRKNIIQTMIRNATASAA